MNWNVPGRQKEEEEEEKQEKEKKKHTKKSSRIPGIGDRSVNVQSCIVMETDL